MHITFERAGAPTGSALAVGIRRRQRPAQSSRPPKLPLTIWFLAMHRLTQAQNNVSALKLILHLGVGYRAAWRVKHKLLHTMDERESRRQLAGRSGRDRRCLSGWGAYRQIPAWLAQQGTVCHRRLYRGRQPAAPVRHSPQAIYQRRDQRMGEYSAARQHVDVVGRPVSARCTSRGIGRTSSCDYRLRTGSGGVRRIPLCEYRPRESQDHHCRHQLHLQGLTDPESGF